MPKQVKFQVNDSEGKTHVYETTLFSCDEQNDLVLDMGPALLQCIANLVSVVKNSGVLDGLGGEDGSSGFSMRELLRRVNWREAPDILIPLMREVKAAGGSALMARVVQHTCRIHRDETVAAAPIASEASMPDPDFRYWLRDPDVRDSLYSDANQLEYWQVFATVLIVNFSQFGRLGAKKSSGLLNKLTAGIWTVSQATSETPTPNDDTSSASRPPRT